MSTRLDTFSQDAAVVQDVDSGVLMRVELVVRVRGRGRERRPPLLEMRRRRVTFRSSKVATRHGGLVDRLVVFDDRFSREAQRPDGPNALCDGRCQLIWRLKAVHMGRGRAPRLPRSGRVAPW